MNKFNTQGNSELSGLLIYQQVTCKRDESLGFVYY